jgi:hypothetical protein
VLLVDCHRTDTNDTFRIDGYYAFSAEFPAAGKTPIRIRGDIVLRQNADSSFSGQYWLEDGDRTIGFAPEGSLLGIRIDAGSLEFFVGRKSLHVKTVRTSSGVWKGELKSEEFGTATVGRISLARTRDLYSGDGLFELTYQRGEGLKEGLYTGFLRVEDTAPENLEISGELRQYERDSASRNPFLLVKRIPVNSSVQIEPTGRVSFTMPFEGGVTCSASAMVVSGAVGNCAFGSAASNRIQFDYVKIPPRTKVLTYPAKSDTLFDADVPERNGPDLTGSFSPKRGSLLWLYLNEDSVLRIDPRAYARIFTYRDDYLSVDSISGINHIDRFLVSGADTFATASRTVLRVHGRAASPVFEVSKALRIREPVKDVNGFWFSDGQSLFHIGSAGVTRDRSPWVSRQLVPVYGGLTVLGDSIVWLILHDTSSTSSHATSWYSAKRDQRGWKITRLQNAPYKDSYVFLTADSTGFYDESEICLSGTDLGECAASQRRTVLTRLSPRLEFSADTLSVAVSIRDRAGGRPFFGRSNDGLALLRFDSPSHVHDTLFVVKRPAELTPAVHILWFVSDRNGGAFAKLSNDVILHFH